MSLSGSELVISERRLFRRRREWVFTENVSSIHLKDSEFWPGFFLGAVPVAAALEIACEVKDCYRGNLWGLAYFLLVMPAGIVGLAIDELITKRVYERPPLMPQVTVAPLLGRQQIGVGVQVRF